MRQVKSSKERVESKFFNLNDKNYSTTKNRFLKNTPHLILFQKKNIQKLDEIDGHKKGTLVF